MAAAQPDTECASSYKPIIALSASAMPPEAPSEEGAAEGAAEGVSAPPPTKEVRTEVREPERPAAAPVAPSGGTQSSSSFPSLSDLWAWTIDRGKAPMVLADDTRLVGHVASSDAQVP